MLVALLLAITNTSGQAVRMKTMKNFTDGGIQFNTDESAGSNEGVQVGGMGAEVERNGTEASEARDTETLDATPKIKRQPIGFH